MGLFPLIYSKNNTKGFDSVQEHSNVMETGWAIFSST